MAVTNSIGRLCTAAGPLVAGLIATSWFGGSIAMATTVVSALIVVSLIGLMRLPETHGQFVHGEIPTPDAAVSDSGAATVSGRTES
jgi:hypothetical protein